MNRIFQAFEGLAWQDGTDMHEDKFNKEKLHEVLKSVDCLSDIEIIDEKSIRRAEAIPFFRWAACGESLNRIDGHSQSDCLFRKNNLNILIENKIIRGGKKEECNIKNAMVQTIARL